MLNWRCDVKFSFVFFFSFFLHVFPPSLMLCATSHTFAGMSNTFVRCRVFSFAFIPFLLAFLLNTYSFHFSSHQYLGVFFVVVVVVPSPPPSSPFPLAFFVGFSLSLCCPWYRRFYTRITFCILCGATVTRHKLVHLGLGLFGVSVSTNGWPHTHTYTGIESWV